MKIEIDIENTNKATRCNFLKKCLEGLDTSSCCKILVQKPLYLVVSPVSTFKSSNCAYKSILKNEEREIHICSCPIRLAVFEKYGK